MADPITETERKPETTAAAGMNVKKYYVIHEFVDSHGSRWLRDAIISLPEEEAAMALDDGVVQEYEEPPPVPGTPGYRPPRPGVATSYSHGRAGVPPDEPHSGRREHKA
jgi:hypothetical protein